MKSQFTWWMMMQACVPLVTRLLRSYNLQVITYESAVDFLERLPGPGPGCVLLDLSMPGMSGLELQEAIAATRQSLVVVFLTGQGDVPASVKAMKAGAIDFLTKPFEDQALVEAVQEAIRKSKSLNESEALLDRDWAIFQRLTPSSAWCNLVETCDV